MVESVKRPIEWSIDFLVGEVKRFGTTPSTKAATARRKTEVPQYDALPSGLACAAPVRRKVRKAARAVSHPGRSRAAIGKPTNVVKDLAVKHGGKIARDIKQAVAPASGPPVPVNTAPATNEAAFRTYMHSLFPGWKEEGTPGFALGDLDMADELMAGLLELCREPRSAAPYAMAIALAQRLADATDGDIRHARQVFGYMTENAGWLDALFRPADAQPPEALLQRLQHALNIHYAARNGIGDNDRIDLREQEKETLALRVAISLSRHPHDFRALRKLIHPELALTPDDTRVYTKPAPHWLDPSDPGCADGLLRNILQALDLAQTTTVAEDRRYAERCLTMLCDLRARLPAEPAALDANHAFMQYQQALTANQNGDLYAWNQGFRSEADIWAAGRRMQKNPIWLQRNEAIMKRAVLKYMPAPLRVLFWGKAPFRGARMGDGGASMKHPRDEMQAIYDHMLLTLSSRLYRHLAGSTAQDKADALVVKRGEVMAARQARQPQVIRETIEKLLWMEVHERFTSEDFERRENAELRLRLGARDAAMLDADGRAALRTALQAKFRETGIHGRDLEDYLRQAGHTPDPGASLDQLIAHCLPRLTAPSLHRAFDQWGLLSPAGPMPQIDREDTRHATTLFDALGDIEKGDIKPRDASIRALKDHMVNMVRQNQDNKWSPEEKLGSGVNGTVFAGFTKFNSFGARITAILAGSAYFGIESKNWGMEITFGRRTHRNTGGDVRYVAGSEDELGEHLKMAAVASLGYDSEHVDTEGIKILVRRDYDDKGDIQVRQNGEGVAIPGENGQKLQTWRDESQRVLEFFTNAAESGQFPHVDPRHHDGNAPPTVKDYDPRAVFNSFATEFFDSKLISVSQTHATTSTQKVSGYLGGIARAALERNGRKFQIGGSAVLLQGVRTATKSATQDQNGKQALNMVSYNHAVDLRSGIGVSAVVTPGFNESIMPSMSANPIGTGVMVTYRAKETRGQISLLQKDGLTDAVFSFSGENYNRAEDFRAAVDADRAAWVGYFGSEAKLNAAIEDVLAFKGQNIVLMIRRRMREHVGVQIDALNAQIAFHQSIVENPHRTPRQRERAAAHIHGLQAAVATLLARPDSFEPFGLGAFSRVEKTRSRGISYYLHFASTQTLSATQELVYMSRKPVERDNARHLGEEADGDRRQYGKLMQRVERRLSMHPGDSVRRKNLEQLRASWQLLLQLRQEALQNRLYAKQRDVGEQITAEERAATLENMAKSLEGLLHHTDKLEEIRASNPRGNGLITEISNPSYHLLRTIQAHFLYQLNPSPTPRAGDARTQQDAALQEIYAVMDAVRNNPIMRQSTRYSTVSESGWADLDQLAGHWERLLAATLQESDNDADQAEADNLLARADERKELDRQRASLRRLRAGDMSDDEFLQEQRRQHYGPHRPARERRAVEFRELQIRAAAHALRRGEDSRYRYPQQEN